MNVREILESLGYELNEYPHEFRAKPIYRQSDSNTSLAIKKDSGRWIDYARGVSGSFEELIKLSCDLKNLDEARRFLHEKRFDVKPILHKPLTEVKSFDKELLLKLKKDYSYWNSRGVSDATLEKFGGGVALNGRMANRFVFPIFDYHHRLIGFTGRSVDNSNPKWKHIGSTSNWVFPSHMDNVSQNGTVILVESIGDLLSLFEAGIYNVLVTFGLNLNNEIINFLIQKDVGSIIISLNNDDSFTKGPVSADKMRKKLLSFFDSEQLVISLPTKKDFGEMSVEEVKEWHKKINEESQPLE